MVHVKIQQTFFERRDQYLPIFKVRFYSEDFYFGINSYGRHLYLLELFDQQIVKHTIKYHANGNFKLFKTSEYR